MGSVEDASTTDIANVIGLSAARTRAILSEMKDGVKMCVKIADRAGRRESNPVIFLHKYPPGRLNSRFHAVKILLVSKQCLKRDK